MLVRNFRCRTLVTVPVFLAGFFVGTRSLIFRSCLGRQVCVGIEVHPGGSVRTEVFPGMTAVSNEIGPEIGMLVGQCKPDATQSEFCRGATVTRGDLGRQRLPVKKSGP